MAPINPNEVFHSQGVLATMADVIGTDSSAFFDEAPVTAMFGG